LSKFVLAASEARIPFERHDPIGFAYDFLAISNSKIRLRTPYLFVAEC
jgi:hypothetical protein